MAGVKVVLNYAGVGELLHQVGAVYCGSLAQDMAASCGDGYEAETIRAGTRTIAVVRAVSGKAQLENLDGNTILKAVGNG